MSRLTEQLKHTDRTSRQTRHHRIYLNQMCNQKLSRELTNLTDEYAHTLKCSRKQYKLEQQRKQVLGITIQQIAHERQRQAFPIDAPHNEPKLDRVLPKINNKASGSENPQSRPSSTTKVPPTTTSCDLFSHKCQLYPCQPVYHYTSFISKDRDQTLRQRKPSMTDADLNSDSKNLQNLLTTIEGKRYQQNRRQLAVTLKNQQHLANRHIFMESAKARLDEQSRLLHEQLTNKRTFDYVKQHHKELRQSIQRHLEISAKFCA